MARRQKAIPPPRALKAHRQAASEPSKIGTCAQPGRPPPADAPSSSQCALINSSSAPSAKRIKRETKPGRRAKVYFPKRDCILRGRTPQRYVFDPHQQIRLQKRPDKQSQSGRLFISEQTQSYQGMASIALPVLTFAQDGQTQGSDSSTPSRSFIAACCVAVMYGVSQTEQVSKD